MVWSESRSSPIPATNNDTTLPRRSFLDRKMRIKKRCGNLRCPTVQHKKKKQHRVNVNIPHLVSPNWIVLVALTRFLMGFFVQHIFLLKILLGTAPTISRTTKLQHLPWHSILYLGRPLSWWDIFHPVVKFTSMDVHHVMTPRMCWHPASVKGWACDPSWPKSGNLPGDWRCLGCSPHL